MTFNLRQTLRNPLFIVLPLVVLLAIAWRYYTYAGRNLSLPKPSSNMLPNGDFAEFSGNTPSGWTLTHTGTANYHVTQAPGYAAGNSMKLSISSYHNGDTTFTSPKVSVQPDATYLFKGYYKTNIPFELLARYYHPDGSSSLTLVQPYPGDSSDWSTASDAFVANNITAVQFVYRVYANGTLALNGLYLQPDHDVYIAPTTTGQNLIPNSQLATGDDNIPTGWSTYQDGNNAVNFTYQQDPAGAYLQTDVSSYKDGEAKWQYPEQSVHANQYLQFSVDLRSTVSAPVVAEYVMDDGSRQYQTIDTAQPADGWTSLTYRFEVPAHATTLFVSLPLHQSGSIATRNYQLADISKSGAPSWKQPAVSITFDDGWALAYVNAVPLLQQYKDTATFYINPSAIETPNFMSAQNLSQLKQDGDEIAAHGYQHDDMTAISDHELSYQLHEGRDYLRKAGYTVTDFATPYGRSDAEVQWYARQYFSTLRSTDTGINTRQNFDPYHLKVFYIGPNTPLEDIRQALQTTKDDNGWLIFVYHQIGDNTPPYGSLHVEESATSSETFQKHLELIHASGIPVQPISTAYAAVASQ